MQHVPSFRYSALGAPAHEVAAFGEVHAQRRVAVVGVMLVLVGVPLFFSLGDHSLMGHSDARYAEVSREMVISGDWLVPHLMGQPHLTKPPLTYWLEAYIMQRLGVNELAARLPSAVAAWLTVVLTLAAGWRWRGMGVGMIAAGVLAVTPLFVIVARMTLTDSLLTLFWMGVLSSGFFAVRHPEHMRWRVMLCVTLALAWLTKGPLALMPLGVVVMWQLLAGRWRELWRLGLGRWVLLSLVPVATWVTMVVVQRPESVRLWYSETVLRVTGDGAHPQPWWYFGPVFLVGLFPATTMMRLPGMHVRWRAVWWAMRGGSDGALWLLAVALPLVFFSIGSGKLMTYILPVAPPLALLTGDMLERWRRGAAKEKLPEVVATLCVAVAAAWVGVVAAAAWWSGWQDAKLLLPFGVVVGAAGWMWWVWKRRPSLRGAAMAVVFLSMIAATCYAEEIEDLALGRYGTKALVSGVEKLCDRHDVRWVTVGVNEPSLEFYRDQPATACRAWDLGDVLRAGGPTLLIVNPAEWERFTRREPEMAREASELGRVPFASKQIDLIVLLYEPGDGVK